MNRAARYLDMLLDHLADRGAGRLSRAVSAGWLLTGLAVAVAGVACVAAAARIGWQAPARECARFLSPSCYSIGGPVLRDTMGAAIAAAAGAALLLGRWLAVRHGRLAPTRPGFALATGLALGLVAFFAGMGGQVPAPPAGLFSWLPVWLPVGTSWWLGAAALIECLAAAASLTDSRPGRLATAR